MKKNGLGKQQFDVLKIDCTDKLKIALGGLVSHWWLASKT